jgi:hypothetical protein
MVVTRIIGGLGNQMFQYAMARAASLRLDTNLKLDVSGFKTYPLHAYGLNHFKVVGEFAEKNKYIVGKPKTFLEQVKIRMGWSTVLPNYLEDGLEFDAKVFGLKGDVYLDGYWQSEQYFLDFEKKIREDFSFKTAPDSDNQEHLDQINSVLAVSVHIRRGDYVNNPTINAIHGTCDLDYYQRAIEFLRARIPSDPLHFFIFSDDPEWVRENVNFGTATTFVSHNDATRNYEDMRLMSACKHHIIANSSFSWWGAWLNANPDKIVVAPKQWFRSASLSSTDIVPDSWNRL